jgi:hypothetical protein
MAGYSGIIRRFAVKGIAKTPVRLKEDWDHLLLTEMKELGYAQLLDLEPFFETRYDHEKDWYEFQYALHGVWVGMEEASKCAGMINGQTLEQQTIQSIKQAPSSKSDWD